MAWQGLAPNVISYNATISSCGKGQQWAKALEMVRRLRRDCDTPMVLFGYSNPFFAYGYDRVCADAADAGADGMLVVDIPAEEALEFTPACSEHGLHFVPLIAPTTPRERAENVLRTCRARSAMFENQRRCFKTCCNDFRGGGETT